MVFVVDKTGVDAVDDVGMVVADIVGVVLEDADGDAVVEFNTQENPSELRVYPELHEHVLLPGPLNTQT